MVAARDDPLASSDDEVEMPDVDLAELMGTPPTRKGRPQGFGGRHGKYPSKEPVPRSGKKLSRQASKTQRQKGLLGARAFKELDTTLQVLGIDGATKLPHVRVTRSPHVPAVAEFPTPRRSSSVVWSPPRSGSGVWRTTSDAGFSDVSLESQSRRGSLPPLHPSTQGQHSPSYSQGLSHQLSPGAPGAHRSQSVESLEEDAYKRLQYERSTWHNDLDNLVQGGFASEDTELAITLASTKANDLKEQLRWWLHPPEPTWQSREQRLDWLQNTLEQARDIARNLQAQGALLGDARHISTYIYIVKDIVLEFRGVTCVIGDAVAAGMRELRPGDTETKRAFFCAQRCVDLIYELTKRLRGLERLTPEDWAGIALAELGSCVAEVVLASLEAAGKLQDLLLTSNAFGFGNADSGMVYGHELQRHAHMLQSVWVACGVLVTSVSDHWSEKRSLLYCEWCKLFLRAASAADRMQGSLRRASTDDMSDLECMDTPSASSGVWGTNRSLDAPKDSTVKDEDLQAQAWLPNCMMVMLEEAEKAAEAASSWESRLDYEGGGTPEDAAEGSSPQGPPGGEGAAKALVDALAMAMYGLAHTGAKRVARLCEVPSNLACWALELLEEQACTAVLFIRDVDRSILGRGENALEHYKKLRRVTDLLVNGILCVRQLLKQKRAADADEPLPPMPPVRMGRYESTSSFTSEYPSEWSESVSGLSSRPMGPASSSPRYASPSTPPIFRPEPAGQKPFQALASPPQLGQSEVPHPRTPPQAKPPVFSTLPHARSSPPPPNPDPPVSRARQPAAAALQRPPAQPLTSIASSAVAIPIPAQRPQQASALPAHSVWGRAASGRRPGSETASAASAASEAGGSSLGADSAADAAAAADRRRLERFAAGEPAAVGTGTAASSRSSSPPTDASLRGASRESSFVFVRPSTAQLPVGSPLRFPAAPEPAAAAATPAAPAVAAKPKPSPASQQASFRGWANLFKEPQAAAASSPTTTEDVVAAKFLEAIVSGPAQRACTAAPASPFMEAPLPSPFSSPATAPASAPVAAPPVSQFMATPLASPFLSREAAAPPPRPATAATAPARLLAVPTPLASPFEVLQVETPSDSAFQSAVEEPVSSKGSSQGPSSREHQQDSNPSSREQTQPASSAGRERTDHDRHKEHRPLSGGWKAKFRRGGRREEPDRDALADAKTQGDADAEKDKHGRKSRQHRHKSGRSSFKELFRGSGSHESGPLCPGKKVCDEAAAQPHAAAATERSKSVIMRFKDAFLSGPHTTGALAPLDSAATAAARQVGKIRHAAKPATDAAQHILSRDTQLDEAWGKPAVVAAPVEETRRGGKRSSGRRSRNRDRGRPGRGDRSQRGAQEGDHSRLSAAQDATSPAERGQPLTAAALAKLNGLVLPWEGHPYWQIDYDELRGGIRKIVGSGSFGKVYLAHFHSARMAVKIISLEKDDPELKLKLLSFRKEVEAQLELSLHPNIVRFMGASYAFAKEGSDDEEGPGRRGRKDDFLQEDWDHIHLAIVMEFCGNGTLYKMIGGARHISYLPEDIRSGRAAPRTERERNLKKSPALRLYSNWDLRLGLARQVAAGVAFMHEKGYVHRDITSYNLLLTEQWECKVADFNLSRAIKENQIPHSGGFNSIEWQAPERLSGKAYGKAADVFSFGVVLWELVTLNIPWHEDDKKPPPETAADGAAGPGRAEGTRDPPPEEPTYQDPTMFVVLNVPTGIRLELPKTIDPPLPELPMVLEVVQQCWAQDPAQRPTMKEVTERLQEIVAGVDARIKQEKARRKSSAVPLGRPV
ncbi:probable serine/threonine-protein kinase STY17 at C-terminar half [Coccomyxa sp. Obi]|nr:probable serine/threonine-protein kinase STY17 at C-terminar half [Coccomyxa sp. Obi]